MVGMQASLLLVLLVGCVTPDGRGDIQLERGRQYLVAAHPEWPPAILGAVASGVICAGMSPEMVRAAWGRPQRMASDRSAWQPRDIWHYAGRQSHADLMGGQTGGAPALEGVDGVVHAWRGGGMDRVRRLVPGSATPGPRGRRARDGARRVGRPLRPGGPQPNTMSSPCSARHGACPRGTSGGFHACSTESSPVQRESSS
jgi:hypothetical protein